MTIDELRAMKNAEPFRPFVIHLTDGETIEVPTADHFSPSPNPGSTRFVVWKNKAFHFFELEMVSDIEFKTVEAPVLAKGSPKMQAIKFVHWEEDGAWIGYLQDYPDYWTQGETLDDLKDHLKDLYRDMTSGEIPGIRKVGVLVVS